MDGCQIISINIKIDIFALKMHFLYYLFTPVLFSLVPTEIETHSSKNSPTFTSI